ncbi:MAG: exopolysaccharide biosynthesis polyprenyl glycosylphosphotransferase, partial [Thermoplasmata archaeon]
MKRVNFYLIGLFDVLIFILSSFFAFFTRFFIFRFGTSFELRNLYAFINTLPFLTLIFIILFTLYGLYSKKDSFYDYFASIISSIIILFLIKFSLSFFLRAFAYPRSVIFISTIYEATFLISFRYLIFVYEKKYETKKIAICIGEGDIYERYGKYEFIKVDNLEEIKKINFKPDAIFLLNKVNNRNEIIDYAYENNIKVFLSPNFDDILIYSSETINISDKVFFVISKTELNSEEKILKRFIDILFSIIFIVILSPLFILIPIIIKSTSKGKVFYIQKRVGESGKIFNLIKFRTMIEGAEEKTGPILSNDKDERVYPFGKFLRKTHLDEIPQLINVIKDEMSLVGPRPERPEFFEEIQKRVPQFTYRLKLKPGITGLAQVFGKYETTPEEKIKYDLIYISNWSPLL